MDEENTGFFVKDRQIVIPGEKLAEGIEVVPGSGTFRKGREVFSKHLGMVKLKEKVVNIIPMSGVYMPRQYDGIIGFIEDMENTVWVVDINSPYEAILPLSEAVNEYVDLDRTDLSRYFDVGDVIYAKINRVTKTKNVHLSMKDQKARKLYGGRLILISPTKVSRVIGKEGSMIEMIKSRTNCQIVVGQNGVVWLKGENEPLAIKAIRKIESNSHVSGLTDAIAEMLKE